MKLIVLIIILIISLNVFLNQVNGLTLFKRIGTTGDKWQKLLTTEGKVISYPFSITGTSLYQFRIDRENFDLITNDLYLNITTAKPAQYTYVNRYFSTDAIADSKTDTKNKGGVFLPSWYANCGIDSTYFSLSLNNTVTVSGIKNSATVPLVITVTVRDVITMCKA